MFRYTIISETMERVPNPLVIDIKQTVKDLSPEIVYLVHTADLAAYLFDDFDYLNNRIRENIYWFETDEELDLIIFNRIKDAAKKPIVITELSEFDFSGDVFYSCEDEKMYILNDGNLYHADLRILSRLHQKRIGLDYVVEDHWVGFDKLKITLKEIGLLDEQYNEHNYLKYLAKAEMEHALMYLYKYMWDHRPEIIYDIDSKYDNPYENLLFVENYLTSQPIYNLDINKFDEYELKYGKLPARYVYSGFHTTTGRIYCNSDKWAPLPNLPKPKRDVLLASPGHYLVEIDFKSFEYDILAQILGLPIVDDPHTEIYDRLVGVPGVPNARDVGKTINYSFIYGMAENRLADEILNKIPSLDRGFRDEFLERLREEDIFILARELDDRIKGGSRNGIIQNFFCRNIQVKKEHATLNNYISSTAADILYIKFREVLDIIGDGGNIVLQNHDSLLLNLKEEFIESDKFDQVLEKMKEPVSGIAGRIDFKYGRNWKDMV
jgi:hypothetical protein